MGWEAGLTSMGIFAFGLSIIWFGLTLAVNCFNKIDIGPLIMWFKMFSIITWITFLFLLFLYCFIGS